jgi:CBS domain-containing protein
VLFSAGATSVLNGATFTLLRTTPISDLAKPEDASATTSSVVFILAPGVRCNSKIARFTIATNDWLSNFPLLRIFSQAKRWELKPRSSSFTNIGCRAVGLSAAEGGDSMTVQTILSRKGRDVVTIEPSATLQAAIATLAERHIGAVVVLGADRRVIGLVSERDIVHSFAEFGADALTKRLAQVMTREVATCGETESAVSIMEQMTTGKFRHIPVIERDQLVGIVSIGDIVKHRLCEMEQESAALRDYIQSA